MASRCAGLRSIITLSEPQCNVQITFSLSWRNKINLTFSGAKVFSSNADYKRDRADKESERNILNRKYYLNALCFTRLSKKGKDYYPQETSTPWTMTRKIDVNLRDRKTERKEVPVNLLSGKCNRLYKYSGWISIDSLYTTHTTSANETPCKTANKS